MDHVRPHERATLPTRCCCGRWKDLRPGRRRRLGQVRSYSEKLLIHIVFLHFCGCRGEAPFRNLLAFQNVMFIDFKNKGTCTLKIECVWMNVWLRQRKELLLSVIICIFFIQKDHTINTRLICTKVLIKSLCETRSGDVIFIYIGRDCFSTFVCLVLSCRYHDTIERYCDETDTWEIVGEMPTSRSWLSCVSLQLRKDIHMSSCPGTPNDNWSTTISLRNLSWWLFAHSSGTVHYKALSCGDRQPDKWCLDLAQRCLSCYSWQHVVVTACGMSLADLGSSFVRGDKGNAVYTHDLM